MVILMFIDFPLPDFWIRYCIINDQQDFEDKVFDSFF